MYMRRRPKLNRLIRLGISLCLGALPISSAAQQKSTDPAASLDTADTFRWIHASSDPQLWQQLQLAFAGELTPDTPSPDRSEMDTYRYKYFQRVGVLGHSALVIIGERPAKEVTKGSEWDEYFSAYNFDLVTQKKAPIDHAEVMWDWKFRKLAKFGPSPVPDVTFTYYTCTECEPEIMFASLAYDPLKSIWQIRSWGDGNDPWWAAADGLVADMDLAASEILSHDCIYGILDLKEDGFQDLLIRCKEITPAEKGRAKVDDVTLLYSLTNGRFSPRRITDPSEFLGLTQKICKPTIHSWLCRLPGYMTATSGQNHALDQMFPNAAPAARDLAHFRSIKQSMSMNDVARECGIPDELGRSGLMIFIYHLDDESVVVIGATSATGPLLYANHISASGKSSEIFVPASGAAAQPAAVSQPTKP